MRHNACRRFNRGVPKVDFSMPEMPHAGEHHGDAVRVGGGDHVVVAHRAARLDDRRGAGLDGRQQAVGEGEEGVGGDDRALGQAARRGRRPRRRRAPCARRCARSRRGSSGRRRCRRSRRPWRRRWRSTSRAWRRGRRSAGRRVRPALGARLRHDLQVERVDHRIVARLHEQAAGDRLDRSVPAAAGSGRPPVTSRRKFFFAAMIARASSVASGAMMTSVKVLTISSAASASSRRLTATMPPKAETGSQASALPIGLARALRRRPRRTGWRA